MLVYSDDAERKAMVLSCSRLSERPCKWNGCDVVMDSAEKLIKHFASEHRARKTSKVNHFLFASAETQLNYITEVHCVSLATMRETPS